MHSGIRIHMLGPVQVERGGEPVTKFESRKALALLCYLALHTHPIPRAELVDLFWGELAESRGRGNLSRVLNNLNSLLPDYLDSNRQTVCCIPSASVWVDTETFDQLYREKTLLAWTAAADLYRGEFMQGMYLDDCPAIETWIVSQREHWRQQATQALDGIMSYHLKKSSFSKGLAAADRFIQLNPWQEEAHRMKMLFLALTGQRSEALLHFKKCQQMLKEELDSEPSGHTIELRQSIQSDDAERLIRWKDRLLKQKELVLLDHNLPTSSTPFYGRDEELEEIVTLFTHTDNRLVTLVGLGGIGKTRLALEAARQSVKHFDDGAFFVQLDTVKSQEGVVAAICGALKVFPSARVSMTRQLTDLLRNKHMLLVLDNFDHLVGEGALLAALLKEAPGLRVLVTSRQRLKLVEERLVEIKGLTANGTAQTRSSKNAPAIALFLDRARRSGSVVTESDLPAVQLICEKLDGMPLGLELAAPWTRTVPCDEIVKEIDKNLDFLADTAIPEIDRHRSVRAAFEQSWQLLSKVEKITFVKLSVFQGGFTQEAYKGVVDSSWDVLASLQDKSLIRHDSPRRFSMHALLHQFGRERLLKQKNLESQMRQQHSRYFAEFLQAQGAQLVADQQWESIKAIEQDLENVLTAWRASLDLDLNEQILFMAHPLGRYFDLRNRFQEGLNVFEGAIQALPPTCNDNPLALARLLVISGRLSMRQGNYEQSLKYIEKGLKLIGSEEGIEDGIDKASALATLGETHYALGNDRRAEACLEDSLRYFTALDDPNGIANAKSNLGNLVWRQGHYARARELHQEALTLREQTKDLWGITGSLNNLGAVAFHLKDYESAQSYFEQGLEAGTQIEDHINVAACLNNLGEVARRQNQMEKARSLHEQSLSLRAEIGDRIGVAYSHNNLGDTILALGKTKQAYANYKNALTEALALDAMPAAVYILAGIARWHHLQEHHQAAATLIGFVQHHPDKGNDVEMRVEQLLKDIGSNVSDKNLQAWLAEGAGLSLDKIVELVNQRHD